MELHDGKLDSKITSKRVFLFCIEDKTIAMPVVVAPSFHVNIRQAHIAEETDVSLRRQVWILDQISSMFCRHPPPTFPILVNVVGSCDVQWQEEKHRVGGAVLISKIEIVTFLGKSLLQAREPSLDEMADPAYPCVSDHCRCSCNSENWSSLFFPVTDFTPSKRILHKRQDRPKEMMSVTSQSRQDISLQTQVNSMKRPEMTEVKKTGEERFVQIRDDIQACVDRKDYHALQKALKVAEDEGFHVRLTTEKKLVEKALRIEKLRHTIINLDQQLIAELKSYLKPPPGVLQTMQATFLMLGNHEVDIKDWAHTANLIGTAGKDNLKRRIKDIGVENIPCDRVQAAKNKLSNLQLDDIRATSAGASAFYVWVTGMVAECESRSRSPSPSTSERQKLPTQSESYEQS